jgi:hypothetical protein
MNKKKIIIIVIIFAILSFVANSVFNQREEFKVEDVMFDRGGVEY